MPEASTEMSGVPSAVATLKFSSAEEHRNYNAMEVDSSTPSSTTLAHPHNRQRCWGMCKNQARCHKVGELIPPPAPPGRQRWRHQATAPAAQVGQRRQCQQRRRTRTDRDADSGSGPSFGGAADRERPSRLRPVTAWRCGFCHGSWMRGAGLQHHAPRGNKTCCNHSCTRDSDPLHLRAHLRKIPASVVL